MRILRSTLRSFVSTGENEIFHSIRFLTSSKCLTSNECQCLLLSQEYSRGTTASTEVPKFSRPYLSPSKIIPNEYLTTTEPVVSSKNSLEETEKEIEDVLAGFSFNDLEHEGSASDQVDISHVQVKITFLSYLINRSPNSS